MPGRTSDYGPEVQKVNADTPLDDIIYLLKRDGGVFVKALVAAGDVDQAYEEVKDRLDADVEWQGAFFPSEFAHSFVAIEIASHIAI